MHTCAGMTIYMWSWLMKRFVKCATWNTLVNQSRCMMLLSQPKWNRESRKHLAHVNDWVLYHIFNALRHLETFMSKLITTSFFIYNWNYCKLFLYWLHPIGEAIFSLWAAMLSNSVKSICIWMLNKYTSQFFVQFCQNKQLVKRKRGWSRSSWFINVLLDARSLTSGVKFIIWCSSTSHPHINKGCIDSSVRQQWSVLLGLPESHKWIGDWITIRSHLNCLIYLLLKSSSV